MVRGHSADGGDSGLDGLGPGRDGQVVGLVHDAEDDVGVVGVLGGKRRPESGELVVGRAALADDLAVPAGIVVDVQDALGPGGEAARHQVVVVGEVGGVEVTADDAVGEVLPADAETEHVQVVVAREVLHLRRTGAGRDVGDAIHSTLAVGVAAKVKACDVDAGIRRVASGASCRRRSGRGSGAGGGRCPGGLAHGDGGGRNGCAGGHRDRGRGERGLRDRRGSRSGGGVDGGKGCSCCRQDRALPHARHLERVDVRKRTGVRIESDRSLEKESDSNRNRSGVNEEIDLDAAARVQLLGGRKEPPPTTTRASPWFYAKREPNGTQRGTQQTSFIEKWYADPGAGGRGIEWMRPGIMRIVECLIGFPEGLRTRQQGSSAVVTSRSA